jgi:hypothetical protein
MAAPLYNLLPSDDDFDGEDLGEPAGTNLSPAQ